MTITFRRLATRPVLHAESEPGAGDGEPGRALLGCITGFYAATRLPPAGARRAGDAERRRRILAAVGAVVAYAAARWPQHGSDINEHLTRAAREWSEQNAQIASASRWACRHTDTEWPGRLAADKPGSHGGSGIPPTGGHAIENAAAASRRRRRS